MKRAVCILWLAVLACAPVAARTRHRVRTAAFVATAYVRRGTTSSGIQTQHGLVAADRRVLPVGTLIRVRNAGRYSGTYVVADTGGGIRGRHIDIFVHNRQRARQFGRKVVLVDVLRWGETAAD